MTIIFHPLNKNINNHQTRKIRNTLSTHIMSQQKESVEKNDTKLQGTLIFF